MGKRKDNVNIFGFGFSMAFFVVLVVLIQSISFMFNDLQVAVLWVLAFMFTSAVVWLSFR